MTRTPILTIAAAGLLFAVGPTFKPDVTFKGSSLTGWHTLGEADWKASNGVISGTPKSAAGGWLMLDKSIQDVGFFANFRCTGGCKTGVLLRAEKTNNGMKGIFVALDQGDLNSYAIKLDAQGRELSREKLRASGGQLRIAPPRAPAAAGGRAGRGAAAGGRGPGYQFITNPPVKLPISAPDGSLRPGDWNQIEILIDANIVRAFPNDSSEVAGGAAEEEFGRFGPLALYVGGSGQVDFKDVAYRDINVKVMPKEQVSSNFRMQRLNEFFYSWGTDAADVNRDGVLDVIAGPYVYFGPDYTSSREIYLGQSCNPSGFTCSPSRIDVASDFTGDGWPDVAMTGDGGINLYVNPKNEQRRWNKYRVVDAQALEIMEGHDIFGDGKMEIFYGAEGYIRYARPDPANPTGKWIVHSISGQGPWGYLHSIGAGDINGDGRKDIVSTWGWWEQPPAGSKQETWTYHPEAFGRWTRSYPGGGDISVYDVNGDGLNDVVTALQGHGIGLAWFEQKRDAGGKISFVQHMILDDFLTKNAGGVTFTEPHASITADVDGDGVPDFIVGKRHFAHQDDYYDPDAYGAPVLYAYRTVRNPKVPGGAEFVPELIHNRSGAGSTLLAVDLNKDGAVDIVTSTDRGTFIFWGKPRKSAK